MCIQLCAGEEIQPSTHPVGPARGGGGGCWGQWRVRGDNILFMMYRSLVSCPHRESEEKHREGR